MTQVPAEARSQIEAHGVSPSDALTDKLGAYLHELLEINQAFNLTAVTDPDEAWVRHIADSLSLAPELSRLPDDARIVDVGSGGGLPGIPLAIAFPKLRFTLLEATGKKARFLDDVARALGLTNVSVVCERAEVFGQSPERERFDAATSRAVSRLNVLLELTLPLLRVQGVSLCIKGAQAEQEVAEAKRALNLLHAEVRGVRQTPTGTVVSIVKSAPTPARYPRRSGEPKRSPL